MAEFYTETRDYERYGLDDSRCSVKRPTGLIKLSIARSEWKIKAKIRKWIFKRRIDWIFTKPLVVRKLFDRFYIHFSFDDILKPSIVILVPFSSLSESETKLLKEIAEKRHSKNSIGEFYGVSDECMCINACVPLEIAPDLIGYQEEPEHCYFKNQPQTNSEIEIAIDAVYSAFVGNLRYNGSNPKILQKIRARTRNLELDFCQEDLCDYPTDE